jgi:FkbM family methyltransferase
MSRAIKILVILAAAGVAAYFYHPLRLAALRAVGRTSLCPLRQTLASRGHGLETTAIKDRLLKESHLVEKDPAGYHLWQTPQGRYWIPAGSDYALFWNLAEEEQRIYAQDGFGVRRGDVVLDCGASIGDYTRQALADGARLVVAIELAPENLECLRRNLAAEIAAGRAIVYPKGVWDKDDFLTLSVNPASSPADSVVMRPKNSREGPRVPLTTIDKLVAELKLDRVDFIKMDIEGAERNALMGARVTLAKFHPRMALSAYHLPDDPQKIPELVRAAWAGYRMACGPCADGGTFVRPDVLYFY